MATTKLWAALAVSHGNRHNTPRHARKPWTGVVLDLHQYRSAFELFTAVTYKSGPVIGFRDQAMQLRQHLTAVTDTQGQGISGKKRRELIP